MKKDVTVVLVDDVSLALDRAVVRLRKTPGVLVLAASAAIEVAVRQVRETAPDITLLNLVQQGEDNLTLTGALHGEAPDSRVIVMGIRPLEKDLARLIRAGAAGFVMAGTSFERCLQTITTVADGIHVLPLELTRSLFAQLNTRGRVRQKKTVDVQQLTPREREVADLVVGGLSNKEIARRLKIAVHTAKKHVHQVLSKLHVNGRLEVAGFSRERPPPVPAAQAPHERSPAL